MPRRGIPSDQAQRLKDLYDRQRAALLAYAESDAAATAADQAVIDAQQHARDARANTETTYQALVGLVGAAAAAELTGRRGNGKRTAPARSAPDPDPALAAAHTDDAAAHL